MADRYWDDRGRGERYGGRHERVDRDRGARDYRSDDRERSFDDARGWARDDEEAPRSEHEQPYETGWPPSGGRRFTMDDEQARREPGGGRASWARGYPDMIRNPRETDYSGMSFGAGHHTDARVYPPGTGLEAGYMAPPALSSWERPSARAVRGRRDIGEPEQYRGRPRDPHASWQPPPTVGPYVGRGPRGYQRSDERIREELNERLTAHGHVDATDIECEVRNGEVTLTGYVNNRAEKHEAEDVANDIAGVHDVHNRLRIRTHAGEEGVGRTSVLGLTESEAQNRSSARATQAAERPRTRG